MEAILEDAALNTNAFQETLTLLDACIAGSAPLYAICALFGRPQHWSPRDIDVWIAFKDDDAWDGTRSLRQCLESHGYAYRKTQSAYSSTYAYAHKNIAVVFEFVHESSMYDVQVVCVHGIPAVHLAERVTDRFDISVCRVVWTPTRQFGLTADAVVLDVRAGRAVVRDSDIYDLDTQADVRRKVSRTRKRIEKYRARGFAIEHEHQVLGRVEARWRLAPWSRERHALFPECFKTHVRVAVRELWRVGCTRAAVIDAIVWRMWEMDRRSFRDAEQKRLEARTAAAIQHTAWVWDDDALSDVSSDGQ